MYSYVIDKNCKATYHAVDGSTAQCGKPEKFHFERYGHHFILNPYFCWCGKIHGKQMEILKRITDDEVRVGYKAKFGREIPEKDLEAYFKLCRMFDIAPVGTFEEIEQQIYNALDSLGKLNQQPKWLQYQIAQSAIELESLASDAAKIVHSILLPITPKWDADQRWVICMDIADAVLETKKNNNNE